MAYPASRFPRVPALRPSSRKPSPVVSRDGKTYTFTIRKDARFSDRPPVTARAFVRAIERILDPAMEVADAGLG